MLDCSDLIEWQLIVALLVHIVVTNEVLESKRSRESCFESLAVGAHDTKEGQRVLWLICFLLQRILGYITKRVS